MVASSTRDSILIEARVRFANQGFEGTSLNDIAEAVGVRRPSVLHYFPSKESIYREVLNDALTDWGEQIHDMLDDASDDPWDRVDSILETSFAFFKRNPEIVRMVRREALTERGHLGFDLGVALRPFFERAVRFFERHMQAGTFRRHDPEHLVVTGYGALLTYFSDHSMLVGLLDHDPFSAEALEGRFLHMRNFVRAALEPASVTDRTGSGGGTPIDDGVALASPPR